MSSQTTPRTEVIPDSDRALLQTESLVDWREASADISSLRGGEVITGFNSPTELDIFTTNVGYWIATREGMRVPYYLTPPPIVLTSSGRKQYIGWHKNCRMPSEVITPKLGQLRGITATMLPDGWVGEQRGTANTERPAKGFVIGANLYSTGKGIVGRVAELCLVGNLSTVITASYKKLPVHDADSAAEALFQESSDSAVSVVRNGLRRVYSAGLPGLGQR